MTAVLPTPPRPGLARMFGLRRVIVVAIAATLLGMLLSPTFPAVSTPRMIWREMLVALGPLVAFGVFEQWPRRLPAWIARWALQVLAVAISVPLAVLALYLGTTPADADPFWHSPQRRSGFMLMTMSGLVVAPWIAVAAIFRNIEFAARSQALAFDLEKSELERRALDARLRLLQAQVEPHFLFNTLANVRELVDARSPRASTVLDHLITYLRAAVPRLNEQTTTVGQELQLVRSYLELMHMRMPDRLQFEVQADEAALTVRCPPTTLLTLVENAVRHGIDPSEEGGRIEVCVQVRDGRCCAQVRDTGMGMAGSRQGLGTGLASLRERLALVFEGDAKLELHAQSPRGTCAEVEFPARGAAA